MFKVSDTVIYGSEGVCQIIGIEEKDFVGEKKAYYVLRAIERESSLTYVPTDSEVLTRKMHPLLSRDELNRLIDSLPSDTGSWIPSERERKEVYRGILANGHREALLAMIFTVRRERARREAMHKQLHMMDEHFLKEAEQCLFSEFRYVLQLRHEEVLPYIKARMEERAES